ncbi:hypothetical protein TNIN_81441, partial [Trichonephila inaurata madagascariensis]
MVTVEITDTRAATACKYLLNIVRELGIGTAERSTSHTVFVKDSVNKVHQMLSEVESFQLFDCHEITEIIDGLESSHLLDTGEDLEKEKVADDFHSLFSLSATEKESLPPA